MSGTTSSALIWGALAGAAVSTATAKPKVPKPPAPEVPPQAAKLPDQANKRTASNLGFGSTGPAAGTLLTGPTGVSNSTLNLGKSTLLGQ